MSESFNQEQNPSEEKFTSSFPPKPIVEEKSQNALRRSLISLAIYALMFYFLFDRNIVYIAAILLVLIIHEMGHFLFMKLFNYSNVKIFIIPLLGAFTSGKKQQVSQWQLSLIILAGPLPGIIIGCLLFWLNKDLKNETIEMLYSSFLVINLLNCLPFFPLDGGRLIETLFFKENYIIRLVFGIISIIVLLFLFAYLNPILLIVPVIIGLELYNENKHQKIREYLKHEKINYHVDYVNLPDKDYWLIRDCLIFSFPKKYNLLTPGKYEYAIVEPIVIQQINAVLQVNLNPDLNLFKRVLMVLFYIGIFVGPILLFLLNR
ncbi:site-2 protease family protein [Aurantibacillus circumpalustris]|uniref:site-2 protease family protein n=1 Tax=Aurantibacillus circumpalustris TaxID=3036359 RepID=UPI00295BF1A6|nr:site-2 protease family protein [Aurantibacillus circumpalustris]